MAKGKGIHVCVKISETGLKWKCTNCGEVFYRHPYANTCTSDKAPYIKERVGE